MDMYRRTGREAEPRQRDGTRRGGQRAREERMAVRLLNLAAVASLSAVLHLACSISPLPLPLPSRSLPQYQTTAPAVQIVAAVPDEQRLDVVERAAAARRRRRALAHLHDGRPLVRVGLCSAVGVTEKVVGDDR